ncbi:MAG: hypothetical protein Q8M74_01650 [Chloroflexota bacterium]|nr:hypothetical protein [Chloroflexota bacterium]
MRRLTLAPTVPLVLVVLAFLVVGVAACGGGGSVGPSAAPVTQTTAPDASAGASTGTGGPTVIPVIVSGQQVVGPNRFLFSFLDPDTNLPAATPDRTASVAFIAPGETDPGAAVVAEFVWGIPDTRGDYIARVDFASAGDWKAIFITELQGSPAEAIGVAFQVVPDGQTVAVGERAPASRTPVATDVGGDLRRLSTDLQPDPAFYRVSVADALARRAPFVLAFATPAFCRSAQCGPTLDLIKSVAKTSPSTVVFINVEPYQLTYTEGRLQPVLDADDQLQPVQSVNEWGILTEPWVFAVDRNGIVRGSFEGVVTEAELKAVIAEIAGS